MAVWTDPARIDWPNLNCPGGDVGCASNTLNYIADVLNGLLTKADELSAQAQDAVQALADSGIIAFQQIQGVGNYRANTDGVPMTYQPPGALDAQEPDYSDRVPEMPTPPTLDDLTLSACEIDGIYNSARAKIDRDARGAVHDVMNRAAYNGVGMSNISYLAGMREVRVETTRATAEAAISQAVQTGQWRREDRLEGAKIAAQVYEASTRGFAEYIEAETNRYRARLEKVKNHLMSEAERRGWSELQVKTILEKEDKRLYYSIERAKALVAVLTEVNGTVAELLSGLASGVWSAIDLGMSGRGGYDGSWSDNINTSYTYSGEIAA